MQKKNLLALVVVAQVILLLAGCTPKIGVSPTSIDFGKDKTEEVIKVWNDRSITLRKLEFKVESNVDWVVGIMPVEDVSKKKKDVKEIRVLVSREGLTNGLHEGKLTICEADSKDKKEVTPVEVGLKITVEGGIITSGSTPDIKGILSALGISDLTYNSVYSNLAQIKEKIKSELGFDINIALLWECGNITINSFIRQEPGTGLKISAGDTLSLYFSSGPCEEGVVEGEGTVEGVVEGTPEGIPEGVVEGTPEGIPEGVVEGEGEGTPEYAVVPSVIGETQAQANIDILAAGLTVGTVVEECNDVYPAGTVFNQEPAGGNTAVLGSAVNLWVSTGPCVEYTQVPDVVGLEVDAATSEIASALLGLGAVIEECNDIYPAGVVFDQEPDGGNTVEVGSLVSIWVSTGPCPEGEGVVEGTPEGVVEGVVEGTPEGVVEGVVEGTPEGVVEGVVEGTPEGVVEGVVEGTPEGVVEGVVEGTPEGVVEGVVEGTPEGVVEGVVEGTVEGTPEGTPEGVVEGVVEGTPEGVVEGVVEGTPEGVVEGVVEGTPEGVVEGVVEGTPEGIPEGVVEGEGEGTPEYAVVPSVIGETQAQANIDILATGLTVGTVVEECNDVYPAGTVFNQEPAGGNTAALGSAVNLWVSTGPCVEYTEVPNVVGIEVDAATAEIASALLGVGAINEECNDIYPAGVVFDQEPDGGNTVEVGSLVSIWVSTGSCPEGEGVVEGTPEGVVEGVVEGTPEGVVEGVVEGTPEGVVEGVVEGTPEGVVEGVVEGTPEGVVEGEGEGTIESAVVPYVIGLTQAQANSDILAAGLTVGDVIETCSADNYPAGIVIGQDPADGGNTAVLGSQVNMVVSCGPCTTVPDVVGEELTSALVTLIGYGLEIGDIINVCDNTAPIGSVLIQDPLSITDGCIDPNTSVIPIDLYVVCGPCYSVTFPYVVGNSESLATSILTGLGYSIDDIVYACDDSVPPGYVIDQYPPSDLNTPPLINTCNLDVDLLVSTGPCK